MLQRNLDTKEDRVFWAHVEQAACRVESWPPWKRGDSIGINIVLPNRSLSFFRGRGIFGIYCSCKSCRGNIYQAVKSELAAKEMINIVTTFLKSALSRKLRGVRTWDMVEEAARGNCHFGGWMRGCKVLVKAEVEHDRALLYITPDKTRVGIHYFNWQESNCGVKSSTSVESDKVGEVVAHLEQIFCRALSKV